MVIAGDRFHELGLGNRRGFRWRIGIVPKMAVAKNLLNNAGLLVVDNRDDLHIPATLRADERINFENQLDQHRPGRHGFGVDLRTFGSCLVNEQFVTAVITLDSRESLFQIATLAELLYRIVNYRSPEAEILFVLLRVDSFELVKIAVNNLEKRRTFGVSGMVDSIGWRFHDDSPLRNNNPSIGVTAGTPRRCRCYSRCYTCH